MILVSWLANIVLDRDIYLYWFILNHDLLIRYAVRDSNMYGDPHTHDRIVLGTAGHVSPVTKNCCERNDDHDGCGESCAGLYSYVMHQLWESWGFVSILPAVTFRVHALTLTLSLVSMAHATIPCTKFVNHVTARCLVCLATNCTVQVLYKTVE